MDLLPADGVILFDGDPFDGTPVAKQIQVPREGRGWAHLSVVIAAHASDTCTVAIHGKLHASDSYRALVKADNSTALSVAQVGGGAVSTGTTVQLMPYMKVVLSGTSTDGASCKVFLEGVALAGRTDA